MTITEREREWGREEGEGERERETEVSEVKWVSLWDWNVFLPLYIFLWSLSMPHLIFIFVWMSLKVHTAEQTALQRTNMIKKNSGEWSQLHRRAIFKAPISLGTATAWYSEKNGRACDSRIRWREGGEEEIEANE